jgi:hypothetical protein
MEREGEQLDTKFLEEATGNRMLPLVTEVGRKNLRRKGELV